MAIIIAVKKRARFGHLKPGGAESAEKKKAQPKWKVMELDKHLPGLNGRDLCLVLALSFLSKIPFSNLSFFQYSKVYSRQLPGC